MPRSGRLTRDRFPYTMPTVAPLYPPPPWNLPDTEVLTIAFQTDLQAALDILPDMLEIQEPATASVSLFHMPATAIGSWYEALYVINATFEGRPVRYDVFALLTHDGALAFGREVLGAPKKLGDVFLERLGDSVSGYAARPEGSRLVELDVTLEQQLDGDQAIVPKEFATCLRILPQADEEGGTQSAVDLLEPPTSFSLTTQWRGTGTITFGASKSDNWDVLPVKKVTGVFYTIYNIVLNPPRLLARL